MTTRYRTRRWPALVLERADVKLPPVRAGALGRGRYVAICSCGEPLNFKASDRYLGCPKCQATYTIRAEEV